MAIMICSAGFQLHNYTDSEGRTALHVAAASGYTGGLHALLADPQFTETNAVDNYGNTALHLAVQHCNTMACLSLLSCTRFNAHSAVNNVGHAILWPAIYLDLGQHVYLAILASPHFTVHNAVGRGKKTALHLAAEQGYAMTCKAILDSPHFTSHNAADEDGNLALHLAAQRGLRETCGLILASPHFTAHSTASKEGRTALHWAVESDLPNVCNQILASRDFTLAAAKDNRGMTALDIAAVQSKGLFSGEICTALLRYFLETDTLLHWTRDVLRMAIEFGNEDVVAAFAAFEFSATPRFLIPLTPCEQMVLRMSRKTLYAAHFATL